VSVTVTIAHGKGAFARVIQIGRIETAEPPEGGDMWDALHTYEAVLIGGVPTTRATFTHRYGDPLHVLFAEAVVALEPVAAETHIGSLLYRTGGHESPELLASMNRHPAGKARA
jgi:hypothetical protein